MWLITCVLDGVSGQNVGPNPAWLVSGQPPLVVVRGLEGRLSQCLLRCAEDIVVVVVVDG